MLWLQARTAFTSAPVPCRSLEPPFPPSFSNPGPRPSRIGTQQHVSDSCHGGQTVNIIFKCGGPSRHLSLSSWLSPVLLHLPPFSLGLSPWPSPPGSLNLFTTQSLPRTFSLAGSQTAYSACWRPLVIARRLLCANSALNHAPGPSPLLLLPPFIGVEVEPHQTCLDEQARR